jgi:hypothetical protein
MTNPMLDQLTANAEELADVVELLWYDLPGAGTGIALEDTAEWREYVQACAELREVQKRIMEVRS